MKAMTRGVSGWRDAVLLAGALTGGGDGAPIWVAARTMAARETKADAAGAAEPVSDGENAVDPSTLPTGDESICDRASTLRWMQGTLASASLAVAATATAGFETACCWMLGLSSAATAGDFRPSDALDCLTLGPFLVKASARRLAQRAGILGVRAEMARRVHQAEEAQRKALAKAKQEAARRVQEAARAAGRAHEEEEDLLAMPVAGAGNGAATGTGAAGQASTKEVDPFAGISSGQKAMDGSGTASSSNGSASGSDKAESMRDLVSQIDQKAWKDARMWRAAAVVRVLARGLDRKAMSAVAPRARLGAGTAVVDREWLARCSAAAASVAQTSAP